MTIHRFAMSSFGIAVAIAGCADPPSRVGGAAWQPEGAPAGEADGGSSNVPDDDDGQWPEPTHGSLPDDDSADSSLPEPDPPDGEDTDAGTGGIPGDTADAEPGPSPYVGGWDIGACQDDITPGGDVIGDFELLDANGDMVRLYDFCHKAVFLTDGAFW